MSYIPTLEVSSSVCLTSIDTRSQILSFFNGTGIELDSFDTRKEQKKKKHMVFQARQIKQET